MPNPIVNEKATEKQEKAHKTEFLL